MSLKSVKSVNSVKSVYVRSTYSLCRSQKSKFRKNRCRLDHSMQNDLTKTMPVLICAETCQKGMFLRPSLNLQSGYPRGEGYPDWRFREGVYGGVRRGAWQKKLKRPVCPEKWVLPMGGYSQCNEQQATSVKQPSAEQKRLLATRCLLLATCYLPRVTCYLLPVTCYLLLATCYLVLATCYLRLATF